MNIFLDLARRYIASGLSVIPIRHGTKEPDNSLLAKTTGNTTNWVPSAAQAPWRVYCDRLATDDELQIWFAEGNAHIGIVGGAVSGGLVRIDFEHRACWPTWVKLLRQTGYLSAVAMELPTVQTPKGHHVYFRMADPPGHVLLSSHGRNNELLVLSETQGEGCYCVAPPSVLRTYPKANPWNPVDTPYVLMNGDFAAVPTFDMEIATQLLDAARFPGLWNHPIDDGWNTELQLHRNGISAEWTIAGQQKNRSFSWMTLHAIRAYADQYGDLLTAVETAPPPPPSYDVQEFEHDDDYE